MVVFGLMSVTIMGAVNAGRLFQQLAKAFVAAVGCSGPQHLQLQKKEEPMSKARLTE